MFIVEKPDTKLILKGIFTMKRFLAILLAMVMCTVAFAGCAEKNLLKVGVTVYEPMNYKDDAGNWTGFDTEFAEKAAKDCGFNELIWVQANGVITTHGGPSAFGIAGFSKK